METMNVKNVIAAYKEAKNALVEALKGIVESKGGEVKLNEPYNFALGDVELSFTKFYVKEGNLYATYTDGWADSEMLFPNSTLDSDYMCDLLSYLMQDNNTNGKYL